MKISIIGPATQIPPVGWGAVESLIWDYSVNLKKEGHDVDIINIANPCLLYTSPSPRDATLSRMPSSA